MRNKILLCVAFAIFGAFAVTSTLTSNSPPQISGYKTINAAELPSMFNPRYNGNKLSDSLMSHIDAPEPISVIDTIRDTVRTTICEVEVVADSKTTMKKKAKVEAKAFKSTWKPHKNIYVPDTCISSTPKKVEFDTLYLSKPTLVIPVRNDTIAQ